MSFWDTFKSECEKIGIKPNPLAAELDISTATVTGWKRGAMPRADTLLKIAKRLDVSMDYLMGYTPPDGDMVLYGLSGIEETGIKMFLALSRERKMQTMAYMEGLGNRNPDSDYEAFLKEREEYFRENALPYAAKGGKNLEDVADIAQRYSDICRNNNSDGTE